MAQDFVHLDAFLEERVNVSAFLVEEEVCTVVVDALNSHSFVWVAAELIIDLVVSEFELDALDLGQVVFREVA